MSVSIVSNDTYINVANALIRCQDPIIKKLVEKLNVSRLGLISEIERLRQANYDSFTKCYPHDPRKADPLMFLMEDPQWHNAQLLKSLQSIHWQLELDDFDDSFIIAVIERLKDALCESFVDYHLANTTITDSIFPEIASSFSSIDHWYVRERRRDFSWSYMVNGLEVMRHGFHKTYMQRHNLSYEVEKIPYFWRTDAMNKYQLLRVLRQLRSEIDLHGFSFCVLDCMIEWTRYSIYEPMPEYQTSQWG